MFFTFLQARECLRQRSSASVCDELWCNLRITLRAFQEQVKGAVGRTCEWGSCACASCSFVLLCFRLANSGDSERGGGGAGDGDEDNGADNDNNNHKDKENYNDIDISNHKDTSNGNYNSNDKGNANANDKTII